MCWVIGGFEMEDSVKLIIIFGLYIFTIFALTSKIRSLRKTLMKKETDINQIETKLEVLEKMLKAKSDDNHNEQQ